MIVDRYTPVDLFVLLDELRLEMDPELKGLDGLLEDDELFDRVKADLCRRQTSPGIGGSSSLSMLLANSFAASHTPGTSLKSQPSGGDHVPAPRADPACPRRDCPRYPSRVPEGDRLH